MGTVREQLATALKEARLAGGFDSQGKLATRLHVSRAVVNKAESANQAVPSDPLLMAWAEATKADLAELLNLAQRAKSGTPEWFMPYLSAEQAASVIRSWAPLVVPGLLQTEAYARALLSVEPYAPQQLQALVDQRIERQQVIARARITAVIDHLALARCIGSPAIMAEQSAYLADLAESQRVRIHIVPEGVNVGLTAGFAVATRNAASTVSLTASTKDLTSTAPDMVDSNLSLFDLVLGSAMGAVDSVQFLRQMEEKWKAAS